MPEPFRNRRRGGLRRGQYHGRRSGHVPRGAARQCREGERTAHPGGLRELRGAHVGPQGGREPCAGRPAQGGFGLRPADRRGDSRGDGARRCRRRGRYDVRRGAVARRVAQARAGRAAVGDPCPRRRAAADRAAGGQRRRGGRGGGRRGARRREPEGSDGAA